MNFGGIVKIVATYCFMKTFCADVIQETSNQIYASVAQMNNVPELFEVYS
ncbi:hypothetical protein PGB90_002733 [Kerria lacca]